MNDQIRKFYYQCQDEGLSTEECYQNFADLIVKECIRLCDDVDLAGADDCIDKIKDSFGVE